MTKNPPPGLGIPATDSIVFLNDSLHDYPEIYYYYEVRLINIKSINRNTSFQMWTVVQNIKI